MIELNALNVARKSAMWSISAMAVYAVAVGIKTTFRKQENQRKNKKSLVIYLNLKTKQYEIRKSSSQKGYRYQQAGF